MNMTLIKILHMSSHFIKFSVITKQTTIMAWRMLAAMPQNQAIGLGIAGGFAITTGTSSYPRKNITNRSIPKHISKEETKEKTNSFLFLLIYKSPTPIKRA